MPGRLDSRVALVTGAGSGIGRASALLFAREGATVVVSDLDEESANATVELIRGEGGRGVAVRCDVGEAEDIDALFAGIGDREGALHVLFANAGMGASGRVGDLPVELWDAVMRVTLRGAFLSARGALPLMLEGGGGSIVMNASVSGMVADHGLAAYSAAKAGVVNLTRSIAIDYAGRGVRANCVCPGVIETPLTEPMIEIVGRDTVEACQPMGRLGRADEVARAVLFFASEESSFVTGAVLPVDGDMTARTGAPNYVQHFGMDTDLP